MTRWRALCLLMLTLASAGPSRLTADEAAAARPKRLLLLYQKPDGHPENTHEYLRGLTQLQELLPRSPALDVRLVPADEPWNDGPELLDGADGIVVFLAEGAKWASAQPARLQALQRLAERQGGFTCIHWGMGARQAEPVAEFSRLFGACHGGSDRKYKFLETTLRPVEPRHPITHGLEPLRLREEFYYDLKWPTGDSRPQPLMEAEIDNAWWPVAWAWERPDGGRSFGFSGLHFHENWEQPTYRQLVSRGVLWTLKHP